MPSYITLYYMVYCAIAVGGDLQEFAIATNRKILFLAKDIHFFLFGGGLVAVLSFLFGGRKGGQGGAEGEFGDIGRWRRMLV